MTVTVPGYPRPCPIPGHPQDDDGDGQLIETAGQRLRGWLMTAPAERIPLPAAVAAWPSAWLMHAVHCPAPPVAVTAAGGVAASWLAWRRHARTSPHPRLAPAEAAAVAAACGGWITAADIWGPLGWPAHLLTWIYAGGTLAGASWLRGHHAVKAARQRRDDAAAWAARKAKWHLIAHQVGLGDFHLQEATTTFLGEDLLLTSAPGSDLASRIVANSRQIAEKLAHHQGLPYGRVDIRLTDYPGQLLVSIRDTDPSVNGPVTHPALDTASPYKEWFPDTATIREPVPIGIIPETGEPMAITLWDEEGGKAIGVFAMTGGGKSNLLNTIRERVTAMNDAVLIQVNAAGIADELAWQDLAAVTTAGLARDDPATGQQILQTLQGVQTLIGTRSLEAAQDGESVFQPTPDSPAVVILVDEVDETGAIDGASQVLEFLASKQRKAAVSLILTGQRATAAWTGGSGVRVNLSTVVTGLLARQTESRHAVGAENDIPDISEYSKGEAGFFQVWSTRRKQVMARGRAFYLGKPRDQAAIIARRDPAARPRLDIPRPAPARPAQPDDNSLRDRLARARALNDQHPGTPPGVPALPAARVPAVPGVPPEAVARLIPMLAAQVSAAAAGLALGVSKSVAHEYLSAMRKYGLAELDRRGRASLWRLTTDQDTGGTGPEPETGPGEAEYTTVADLADAVHHGLLDVDDETRDVLEQAWALAHGDDK